MKTIAEQNDRFRNTMGTDFSVPGRVHITSAVDALADDEKARLIESVRTFSTFKKGNDPYGEHDFGSVEMDGETYFWKIDYYDTSYMYGSPDPLDAAQTRRVMVIMRADEY